MRGSDKGGREGGTREGRSRESSTAHVVLGLGVAHDVQLLHSQAQLAAHRLQQSMGTSFRPCRLFVQWTGNGHSTAGFKLQD